MPSKSEQTPINCGRRDSLQSDAPGFARDLSSKCRLRLKAVECRYFKKSLEISEVFYLWHSETANSASFSSLMWILSLSSTFSFIFPFYNYKV